MSLQYPRPHLEAVIGPAAELHDTSLLVEWEVLNVHFTGGVVDGGGLPLHQPSIVQGCLGGQRHLEVAIGTATVQWGKTNATTYM